MSKTKETTAAEAVETTAEETVAVEETKTAGKELVMYIGPTIPAVATKNTVFNNGLPAELQKEIKAEPAIGALVVPIAKLAKAKKEIKTKNTALEICYRKVEKQIKEKGV